MAINLLLDLDADFRPRRGERAQNANFKAMKSRTLPRRPGLRRWPTGCATLSLALAIGCASPGPLRPPTLNLPELAKELTAVRTGDQVELHWTTPAKTTDKLNIKGPLTAEICRISAPASSAASSQPPCTPVTRLPVQPGLSRAAESLPSALTLDPPVLLAYRVQIFNASQRSAGLSAPVFAAAGAAPPPVAGLRATPIRSGAMLEWTPQPTTAPVELDRLIDGASVPQAASSKTSSRPSTKLKTKSTSKPATSSATPSTLKAKQPFQPSPPPVEARLRTPRQQADPGGTIDRTAEVGVTYRYTAQRVRSLALEGHALEIRSLISPVVTILVRDTFPPQVPTGLAAVPGGATAAEGSIDLSWEPNTESDLAGYLVDRQEVSSSGVLTGTPTRLTPTPILAPAYRDQTAVPNQRYAYRVSAIDTVGNESAPSADIQETRREQ
jgi:hypothetical protein